MIKRIQGTQGGWFPVYWELFDDDNLEAEDVFFFCYLSEIFPILKNEQIIDGIVYKRLSDSFINEKLGWSRPTIRKRFETLENNGYIKLYRLDNKKNGIRYYSILLNIDNPLDSGYFHGQIDDKCHGQTHGQIDGQIDGKNFSIKETKETKQIEDTQDIFNKSGQTKYSTIKDLLNNIDIDNNVRLELNKFFDRPKVKGIYSVDTAKDVIEELQKQYSNNDDIINKIKEANLHGWTSLFYNRIQNTQDTINNQQSSGIERTDWNLVPDELKQLRY